MRTYGHKRKYPNKHTYMYINIHIHIAYIDYYEGNRNNNAEGKIVTHSLKGRAKKLPNEKTLKNHAIAEHSPMNRYS